jgi:hypothetical protein
MNQSQYYQPFYTTYNTITHHNDIKKINFIVKSTGQDNARKQLKKKTINHPGFNNWLMGGENLFTSLSKNLLK